MSDVLGKQFSKEQREAIELFDKDVYVLAGAGSGKTTILVQKFLYAITQKGIEPDRILAITFTERAANEMKTRLVRECDERQLGEFRRKLENSYISTIHSFCARLLKENPIESGIDPFFRVLGQGEAEVIMEKVMDALFEEEASSARWIEILVDFGETAAREALKRFYYLSRVMASEEDLFKCRDFASKKNEITQKITKELKDLLAQAELQKPGSSVDSIKDSASQLLALFEKGASPGWGGIGSVSELKKRLNRRIQDLKPSVEALHEKLDEWAAFQVQEMAEPVKKEFIRVLMRFKESYEKEKKDLAAYDFDDLLYMAYQLLSGDEPAQKEVRERTRNLFSYILVDEHQDTSPLEAAIVDLLKKENNLFLVGDVQQSIYGFRDADPEVFKKQTEAGTAGGRGKKIVLSENYRSREEILLFVNQISSRLLNQADFEPLKAKRDFVSKKPRAIELLPVLKSKEGGGLKKARVVEARTLACHIQEMVVSGLTVEERDGRIRPIRYQDIAILLRKSTDSHLYEKELADRGVPYYTFRGHGFYDQQEVKDLVNFLNVIENPDQDIPLAGVLRSSLVGVSEDALFWLASHAKQDDADVPLASALGEVVKIKELFSEDAAKLGRFNELLLDLRKNKDRVKLSELLETMLGRTHYEAKLLTGAEGRLKAANVRKLVEISRSLEQNGVSGIGDFIIYLKNLSAQEVTEPEAKIQAEGSDGVTISTVHGAKGLEFPCVVIADMGGKPRQNNSDRFLLSKEYGIGVKLKNSQDNSVFPDYSYLKAHQRAQEIETAEADRLFYVAMTRAKEHLILSGCMDAKAKRKEGGERAWMDKVASILGFDPNQEVKGEIEFEGSKIWVLGAQDKYVKTGSSAWSFARQPAVRALLAKGEPISELVAKDIGAKRDRKAFAELKNRLAKPSKSYEEKQDHTVTDLLLASLKDQPTRASIASEATDAVEEAEGEEAATPRNEYGTLFHNLMEFLVLKRPAKITQAFFNPALMRGLNLSERKEMQESVLKFWSGAWGMQIKKARRCYPELPFIYKTKYGILKGQIDLVFQANDGQWIILDYKTNVISPSEKAVLAKQYELQLALYALIFRELYGEAPAKGVLYFSTLNDAVEFPYQKKDFDGFENELDANFLKAMKL